MPDDSNLKLPPQSLEAEQSALGSMLLDRDQIAIVIEMLTKEHFYKPTHGEIFEAIVDIYDKGDPVDLVTLVEHLDSKGQLEKLGGAAYLTSLIESVPSASSASAYAKIVEDKAILRQLIKAGNEITRLGYQADGDVESTLDMSEQAIFDIANRRIFSEIIPMDEAVKKTFAILDRKYKHRGSVSGLPTGFTALDSITTGFQPSDLIILAARPSMGKTALALNIAEHVATEENKAVGIFSLEMSAEQLVTRMLCSVSKVDAVSLRKGFLSEGDWDKLFYGMDKLSKSPIFIVDSPGINTLELRAKARRMRKENNLELIIVDYLQLLAPRRQRDSKVAEVSEMSGDMKLLARELNVPVLVLSQLSRAVEQRTVKRPQLSDLRESGAIE
ncbi:MAG: replicative DNA helicase, partial [bacterium]